MKAKGTAIISIKYFVTTKFGEQGFDQFLKLLPELSREIFEELLSNTWYDFQDGFLKPLEIACKHFYDDPFKGAFEYGNLCAHHDLGGVYKMFIRLGSPSWTISKAGLLWKLYYDTGAVEVLKRSDTLIGLRFNGLEQERISETWEGEMSGWILGAGEVIGVKNPKISISCSQAKGQGAPEFFLSWDSK